MVLSRRPRQTRTWWRLLRQSSSAVRRSLIPRAFRDRYQDALRELVDGKLKGLAPAPREVAEPSKVINLMDALKRSLAQEATAAEATSRPRRPGAREPLPIDGNRQCSCPSLAGDGRKKSRRLRSRAPRPRRQGRGKPKRA